MSVSRKEFIRQGIFAFGQNIVEAIRGGDSPETAVSAAEEYRYLWLDNKRCLAQKGGCFACIDHCPREAVTISLGVGIAIDADLCNGCGECAVVCPISPNVIAMKPKETE
jgi:Pyruvate/2-oxoacid:ferredoxin oxidoreductase delta subunit